MSGKDARYADPAAFRLPAAPGDCLWRLVGPRITEEAAIAEEMEDEAPNPVTVW